MLKRFFPILAVAALSACQATASGTVTPGASTSPSAAASAMASAAPSAAPSAAASASAAPSAAPSAAASATAAPAAADAEHEGEACEHLAEGPAEVKKAGLTASAAEKVKIEHRRWDVQLVANAGKNEGHVVLENDTDGDIDFFLGTDVPFKLMMDGKEVELEGGKKTTFSCATIKAGYRADVGVGQLEIHFGPTDAKAVSLVMERHGEAHDDHN